MTIRQRGRALAIVVPIVIALVAWQWIAADDGGDSPATVTVGTTTVGRPVQPGFVGLSLEFPAIPEYTGSDPTAVNPVFVQLIRNLTPGQSAVLRIGGDSTDSTWWPVPGMTAPSGVSHALDAGWVSVTRALAATLGARLILGVNLAADNPAIAAAEAHAFESGIGSRYVEALEVGNEPDLYGRDPWYRTPQGRAVFARSGSYSLSAFTSDFDRFSHALPGLPLAAPAFAWLPWMSGLGRFISSDPGLALVTFHRYPLRRCNQSAASPLHGSIPNLLSDVAAEGLARPVASFAAVAHSHGLSFRVDEMNSVSCHGEPGVSDAFASALWALDALFSLARAGVDGVNIHTFPGASYQLFSFQEAGGHWTAEVKPEYYGLQLFSQAAPPGSRLLQTSGPSGPVQSWATRAIDGTTRVVLVNDDPARSRTVLVRPAAGAGVANFEQLLAPDAGASAGVTLGGQSYGSQTSTGVLTGRAQPRYLFSAGGDYVVRLPAASAAMLTLIPALSNGVPRQ
jgi:hypothetical protein